MKILFINAQDIMGGAALAAYRLAKTLETQHNTQNHFIVGKKYSADENIHCTRKNEARAAAELLIDRTMNKLGLQYQYFPFSTPYILKKTNELKPDIISLHNTHEGYFKTKLIKTLSQIAPIAWTLHDMWSFTANAVHTFGDESWKQMKSGKNEKYTYPHIGINTGPWLLKQKKRIYRKSNLHIITPSAWIHEQAQQSPVFTHTPITHIHHGIDLNLFKPLDRKHCRNVLGIEQNAPVIVFTSAGDLDICPWKGGPLLIDILKHLNQITPFKIHLLAVGKGRLKAAENLENLIIHRPGFVTSPHFMPILLSAADLFIYPTRADSFGLSVAEALGCGIPAVSFNIGGVSDIIKENISGTLINPFDTNTFAQKTLELLQNKEKLENMSQSARNHAEKYFKIELMAHRHHELFQQIIEKS